MKRNHSPENVSRSVRAAQAVEMLSENIVSSTQEAANLTEIPASTLRHFLKGRPLIEEIRSAGKGQRLTPEEERSVILRCEELGKTGFPPVAWDVRGIAETIGRYRVPNLTLGKKWYELFKKRHKELRTTWVNQIDYVRAARGDNIQIILGFFENYKYAVEKYHIKPTHTYNLDEIGFIMGYGKSVKVLEVIRHPRQQGKLYANRDGNREMVTVIETICGDGTDPIDPMIIYQADKMIFEWFKDLEDVPADFLFGASPNGWTDSNMAMRYLEHNFGPGSVSAQKANSNNEYRMLIYDGHSSHVNAQFMNYCVENRIIPLCLPPYTTHRLQPLDVCVFSPYKEFYGKALRTEFQQHRRGVSKKTFYPLLVKARSQAFTESNIRSGFWHTGLIPLDPDIVIRNIPAPINASVPFSNTQDRQEISTNVQYRQLDSYDIDEIAEVSIPRNKQEYNEASRILLNSFDTNSLWVWRRREWAKKLIGSGESAYLELEAKDRKIAELIQENKVLRKEKEPNRKTKIPIEGLLVTNKKEISDFFLARTEKEKERQRSKLEKQKAKAKRFSEDLIKLEMKRKKAEELEIQNRLPARWLSSQKHSEMEQKIRSDLEELRKEIAKIIEERESGDTRDEGDSEGKVYSSTEDSENELGSGCGEIDANFPEF